MPTTPTAVQESWCSAALIFGMIMGQLVAGALGDVMGRHRAMSLVMVTQVVAALGSAMVQSLAGLAVWRCVLGVGCGGVYPLAATLTRESRGGNQKLVALTFSFQGVGYMLVPVTALVILVLMGEEGGDLGWRVLLGLGAVPGIWLTCARLRFKKSSLSRRLSGALILNASEKTPLKPPPTTREVPLSILQAISLEKDLIRKLVGTAGCWFIFDVLFYGNTLCQPIVLSRAFGETETSWDAARDTLFLTSLALPGYFISVLLLGQFQSAEWIQMQGFGAMGFFYSILSVYFDEISESRTLLLPIYGATFLFSNYGPNSTTFLLPSVTFSASCRSTLNGVAAASGKLGALLGATVFGAACEFWGLTPVMGACGFLAFVGLVLTAVCFPPTPMRTLEEYKNQSQPLPVRIVYSQPSIVDCQPSDDDDDNSKGQP